MSETVARLIYMANQIARNFMTMGEEQAAAATADHITQFWDPRMKQALFANGAEGLSPISAKAVELLASRP